MDEPAGLERRGSQLAVTFADGQELTAEIGSLRATVGTGTVTVTTHAGVLALRFTDRSFAIGDGWNRL